MSGAIALAILAAVFIGIGDFVGGVLGRRDPTPAALLAVFGWMAMISLPVALVVGDYASVAQIGWSIGVGLCWLGGFYSLMLGIAEGKVVIVVPTAGVVSVAIPVIVDTLQGVDPSMIAGFGIAIGITAVAIVGLGHDEGGTRSRRWSALMGLLGGVATGLGFSFINETTDAGFWPIAIASTAAFLLAAGFLLATGRRLRVARAGLGPSVGIAVLFLGSFAALIAAFDIGTLTIVAVIASQYPVVTLLLAAVLWKQKPRGIQYVGAVLALVSVALITIGA
jgi:drug/metabolite transporter (DMT)-like permease